MSGYGYYQQPQQNPYQQYNPYQQQSLYQQPQQYQPPQTVSRREYDDLLKMVGQLGEKFNFESPQNNPVPQQYAQTPQPAQTSQVSFIPVSSENEAWNYPNDLSGNKQFFIDMATMTVYAKWVDSNIDLQRAVGKLQMLTDDDSGEMVVSKTENTTDIGEALKGVDEKLSDLRYELSEEMTEIKALIGAVTAYQTAKATTAVKPVAKTKSTAKSKATKKSVIVEDDEYDDE